MKNIVDKLSTYAALIGVVSAIGGGFYAWGEFNTRLQAIEGTEAADVSGIISNGEAIASIEARLDGISIPDVSGIADNSQRIAVLENEDTADDNEEWIEELEQKISKNKDAVSESDKKVAVALKELELLKLEIQELKLKSSNPLAN